MTIATGTNVRKLVLCAGLLIAAAGSALRGQAAAPSTGPATTSTAPATQPPATGPDVTQMTLRPSLALTRPARRYRLLPDGAEQTTGNAATLYLQTGRDWPDQKTTNEVLYPENEKYSYLDTPTDQLPKAYAERIFEAYAAPLRYADLGARRRDVAWDAGWREGPPPGKRSSFGYLSDMRHMANLLAFRGRYQIVQRDWPAAEYTLQTQFGMA